MIYELIKTNLQNTVFENIYGLVKTQEKNEVTTSLFGTKRIKVLKIPVYENGTQIIPTVPNANKRDLVYIERNGKTTILDYGYYTLASETFGIVIWLNAKGFENYTSGQVINEIKEALKFDSSVIKSIKMKSVEYDDIFKKYTYEDAVHAMTLTPFKAYRINFDIIYLTDCDSLIIQEISC